MKHKGFYQYYLQQFLQQECWRAAGSSDTASQKQEMTLEEETQRDRLAVDDENRGESSFRGGS